MDTARITGVSEPEPRLSISSVNTELAGSNRSGKHRLLPDQAEESGAAVLPAGLLPDQAEMGERKQLRLQLNILLAGACLEQQQTYR